MQDIYWPDLFREVAPFISYTDRAVLLELSGTDAVSPVLLLSVAVHYKKEKKRNFKTYMEQKSVKLMNAYFTSTNRTEDQKKKQNDLVNTIYLFVDKDPKQMNELLAILKVVKHEATKFQKKSRQATLQPSSIKRAEEDERTLRFPFKLSECWMLSATHHSNQHCSSRNCPKSSIDMAPNLFMGFGKKFTYFNSDGEVVAAHSGEVFVHSPCKLQVTSRVFTTFYSHINHRRTRGEYVQAGEILGFIETDRSSSNCNCEVESGNTECSTGPHLHWEVRDPANRPLSLEGMIISGFMIYTGMESYDVGCGPENCHSNMTLEEIENSCSTVYRRLSDNVTFCPSVQGANWGMIFIRIMYVIVLKKVK